MSSPNPMVFIVAAVVFAAVVAVSCVESGQGARPCLANQVEFRDDVIGETEHIWYAIDFENKTMGWKTDKKWAAQFLVYHPNKTMYYYLDLGGCDKRPMKGLNATHQMFPQCVPDNARLVGNMWMFRNSINQLLFYTNTSPPNITLRVKLDPHYIPILYKDWSNKVTTKGLLYIPPDCHASG